MKAIFKINKQSGFSLLELLIYIAILSSFLVVIVNLFFTVSTSSVREEVRTEVRHNLRFASEQITNEVRKATAIESVSPSGDSLQITVDGAPTEFRVTGGVLQKIRGASQENITTGNVTVNTTDPIFTRIGNTIQINLKIDYNDNGKGDYKFFESVKTTASLRL